MTETNPFGYYLPSKPEKLIIGSFPCHNGLDYGDWFYCGSGRNYFWQLLSELYMVPARNMAEKEALCEQNNIALTDIAYRIERKNNDCSDANLKITCYNQTGLDACLNAGVKKIFFTSRYVENHFRKLYPAVELPARLLPSPSPAANRHIGGLAEFKKMRTDRLIKTPYDYLLLKYRDLLLK